MNDLISRIERAGADEQRGKAQRLLPGGAPDQETQDLMGRLSDLQMWCALMAQKDNGGVAASRLIQDTRVFIVERLYPKAKERSDG